MSIAESTAPTGAVTVHLDAGHLPGVVNELALELSEAAEDLDRRLSTDLRGWGLPSAETMTIATEVRRLIELLDQLGWQTTRDALLTADRDQLQARFADLQERGLQELQHSAAPDNGDTYINPMVAGKMIRGAYAGATSVLEQLPPSDLAPDETEAA